MTNNETMIQDMYLAAAIISYGGQMVRIDRRDKKRQKFCFKDTVDRIYVLVRGEVHAINNPTFEQLEMEFMAKRLLFPPNYPDAIRSIKSAIHIATE